MSVNVIYTGSSGNSYSLKTTGLKIKEANYHNYEWTPDTTERQFGVTVNRFKKAPIAYQTTFMFTGPYESNKALLEALHADFERDIISNTPGTLTWGECYIKTFVRSSSTFPDEDTNLFTRNVVEFYCPYPFWIAEKSVSITPLNMEVLEDRDKGYTYEYWYKYAQNQTVTTIQTSANYYSDCDFRMTAYGPFSSLYVTISGQIYNISFAADAAEYIVVDTRKNGLYKGQAYLVRNNGDIVNVFDYRNPNYELFKKVPAGTIVINYPRTYGIDLTFFMERSEPIQEVTP